jgi:2-polyprenyl-6-methoxyphenol hydroxylase-like FAD-dependent oxidoreductase
MEIFRRLGVAESLRSAGLPEDYANDVSYRTSFSGKELTRIPIPCRRDRYTATEGPDANWPTPEPPHRINQTFLEPILFEHAKASPRIRLLNETAIMVVSQDDIGAAATARHVRSGAEQDIHCQFIIGCDGGGSMVRKSIGAEFAGDAVIQRVQSTYIRAADLIERQDTAPAWATFSLNPTRSGNVYAIDGKERWVVHNYLKPDEPDFDSVDRDWAIRVILGVGADFEYDVIAPMDWYGRRLVADKFRDRRIYICGDAAHIWVPYAGYGMNAGIADAMNLSWTLAAHLKGWGAPGILDAYEQERLPITQQVSHFVMDHAHAMAGQRGGVPANIEDDDAEGEAARQALGQKAYDLNVQQYCAAGLNFGYFYENSPIIVGDGAKAPGYSMATFTASTVPGCRTPHFWLPDGASLYDAMGPEFTLLRFDPSIDVDALLSAGEAAGVPLSLLDVPAASVEPAYTHQLILSRPDQHIAWRGNTTPDDPAALINCIRGAG